MTETAQFIEHKTNVPVMILSDVDKKMHESNLPEFLEKQRDDVKTCVILQGIELTKTGSIDKDCQHNINCLAEDEMQKIVEKLKEGGLAKSFNMNGESTLDQSNESMRQTSFDKIGMKQCEFVDTSCKVAAETETMVPQLICKPHTFVDNSIDVKSFGMEPKSPILCSTSPSSGVLTVSLGEVAATPSKVKMNLVDFVKEVRSRQKKFSKRHGREVFKMTVSIKGTITVTERNPCSKMV